MTKAKRFMVPGAALFGMAVAYLFDPEQGRRRRAVTKDRAVAFFRRASRRAGRRARYVEGHARGIAHSVAPSPRHDYNDATLKHKIESEVLRHYDTSHLNIHVQDGVAVLRGELRRPDEIKSLEQDVARVPGVSRVENLVHTPS